MLETSERADPQFRSDVLAGLKAAVRAIPARWLYDRAGSELFEAITRLPEYYPTRTETALLRQVMPEIAALLPSDAAVIEFGAGSSAKTPILLNAIAPAAYVPIDISADFLADSADALDRRLPAVRVFPVAADFTGPVELPAEIAGLPRVGFFPGSTIGNFVPRSATDLLRRFRSVLGTGARLLIGMDRVKPADRLMAAYADAQGITARFNLNLLDRINRELDGTIERADFRHEARWNDRLSRIEMHLVAQRDTRFTVDGETFNFAAGQSIHTENSHKYTERSARLLLLAGGWTPLAEWTDPAGDFSVVVAEAEPDRFAP